MKELFYCPDCGAVIDMTRAFCSACNADVSALTGVRINGSSAARPPKNQAMASEPEETAEKEMIEEEDDLKERFAKKEQKVSAHPGSGAFGRWLKRTLFAGIVALGIWGYQQAGGIEGLKSLLSGNDSLTNEQVSGVTSTDMTTSPATGPGEVTMSDFAGEWDPGSLNPQSNDRMANVHVMIRPDEKGTLVIYFQGNENAPDDLNYRWSALKGRKVQCSMSYRDNPENVGLVLLELSEDKNMLSYSTLDRKTQKVKNTHKFRRVR